MAYKESNPAKPKIIMFTITVSFFILIFFVLFLGLLLFLISLQTDNPDYMLPFFFAGYAGCGVFGNILPILLIFQYAFLFFKRGVYGEKHSRACIQAFFIGIFGMIIPVFLVFITVMFLEFADKIYIFLPYLIHSIPVAMMFAIYVFSKDIGGGRKTGMGIIIFGTVNVFGALLESIALYQPEDLSINTGSFLLIIGMVLSLAAVSGLVFMILGLVDAYRWTDTHKPLIDTQQKQTLEMQQNQIRLQQKQLELQYQQLELQKQSMEMLSEIREETIGEGGGMIPERTHEDDDERKAL